ncbi:hypothetical protein [Planococcus halocryophilus]|uniref:Uncharacterized protein n=1 Tax=Planococcus halocryophilus TaxID=1215089 RepID=A0A1C7DQI9_9BACL|nr:hypothetical protein [Planococcus halocryophilus]ANU13463.1 hypothetical protein BBI08_06235 [Planococcus halocryophilus]
MTKVTLKMKKGETVEKSQHEIESLTIEQFQESMGVIKEVFEIVQSNDALKDMFNQFYKEEELDDKELSIELIFQYAIGAYDLLLINLPDQAIRLVSAMSGISLDVLKKQKLEDFYDFYDAVLEENDIEKLFKRGKLSLATTKIKLSFAKKLKKATA